MNTNQKDQQSGIVPNWRKAYAFILSAMLSIILIACICLPFRVDGQNIGIGTTTPTQKLDVNGNIKLGDNIMVEGNQTNIKVYRNLASYAMNSGTAGAFVIHTNQPIFNLQWGITVEGYIYSPAKIFKIYISGFMNEAGSCVYAYEGADKLPVRVGSEAGNLAVIIGDTSATYLYPQLVVTEYQQCYLSLTEAYADGWTITIANNLSAFTGKILLTDKSYMQWTESSSNIYRPSGNVGVGTSTPTQKLDVSGGDVRITDSDPYLKFNISDANGDAGLWFLRDTYNSRAFIFYNNPNKYIKMSNDGSNSYNDFIIDSSGCVAINPAGLPDIAERFTVYGNQKGGIRGFTSNSSKYSVYGMNTYNNNYGTLGSNHYGVEGYLGNYIAGNFGMYGQGPMVLTYAGYDYTPIGILGGVKGIIGYGSWYTFGVAGFTSFDAPQTGGCFGGRNTGGTWGCLGYINSGWTTYGGYFTSTGTGTGDQGGPTEDYEGNGIGAYGELFGADIHGEIYGTFTEGSHYGLYSKGDIYRTGLDMHLQEQNGNKEVLYTNVSTDVTVQTSGIAQLSAGQCEVVFDEHFRDVISDEFPVIVTVTPIGESAGLHLASMNSEGFVVQENNAGRSMVEFTYIAIGRRKGYENPQPAAEVIDENYLDKLSVGLHNDNDRQNPGLKLSYKDGQLVTEKLNPPETFKPNTEINHPEPGIPTGSRK
jgi:hypothetical protein